MKRIHRRLSRRADVSRGFTLLEIVLALGLASLLLAALYTALQMHWSSSAARPCGNGTLASGAGFVSANRDRSACGRVSRLGVDLFHRRCLVVEYRQYEQRIDFIVGKFHRFFEQHG